MKGRENDGLAAVEVLFRVGKTAAPEQNGAGNAGDSLRHQLQRGFISVVLFEVSKIIGPLGVHQVNIEILHPTGF